MSQLPWTHSPVSVGKGGGNVLLEKADVMFVFLDDRHLLLLFHFYHSLLVAEISCTVFAAQELSS